MWSSVYIICAFVSCMTTLSLVAGNTKNQYYGKSGNMGCEADNVFAITYFNKTNVRLEMRCVTPLICGKPGVKVGTSKNCLKDGEFMAKANENGLKSGNVIESCNRYMLPPKDDYEQVCITLVVNDGKIDRDGGRRKRSISKGRGHFENNLSTEIFLNTQKRIERQKRAVQNGSNKTDVYVAKSDKGIQMTWYVKDIARQSTSYKVVGCLVVCQDNKKPNDPKIPANNDQYQIVDFKSGPSVGSAFACFSGESTVETTNGSLRMDKVEVGDKVLAFDAKLGIYIFAEIQFFIHREPAAVSEFVVIETEAGLTLTLTNKHLVPVGDCNRKLENSPEKIRQVHMEYMKPADQAQVGQCVLVRNNNNIPSLNKIVRLKSTSKTGIFAPVNKEGNVIVNGVHASCYSEYGDYAALRGIFGAYHAILDVVENLFSINRGTARSLASSNVPLSQVMRLLIEAGKLFK